MENDLGHGQNPDGENVTDLDRILAAMEWDREEREEFKRQMQQHNPATGLLEKFKNLFPTEFEGTTNPMEAENWLKSVERVLTAM